VVKKILHALSAALLVSSCVVGDDPPGFVRLADRAVDEASGLAVSRRDPAFLWLVNDSGAPATLHLAGRDGSTHGTVAIRGVENIDWEDLATFTLGGEHFLLIADTGDNNSNRPTSKLHCIAEPSLPESGETLDLTVDPAWSITFRYEDGPGDCESVAVDAAAREILLISKRTKPPALYRLPLAANTGGQIAVAERLGPVAPLPPPTGGLSIPFGSQPTALDLSADGRHAAVLTYVTTFVFPRRPDESWTEAFARDPIRLPRHKLPQAEALAFSPDARIIFVTSEGSRPFLLSFPRPDR